MHAIPSITVVVPLYNKAPYILRAVNSVLAQTFQAFEMIVVDDGSTDNGPSIVKMVEDPRVRLIHQENGGVSAARNRGIDEAQAQYIAFLDADDEWLPDHLATLIRLRESYPEAGAYGTAYLIASRKSSGDVIVKARMPKKTWIPTEPWEGILPSYFKAAAVGYNPISASSVAIPKSVLVERGGFSTETWWGEDSDLWGRIALKYPIAFSWQGKIIAHADASNRATHRIKSVKEHIFISSVQKALQAGEVPPEQMEDLMEYIALKQIQTAHRNLAAKRPDLARMNLKECKTRRLWRLKYSALIRALILSAGSIRNEKSLTSENRP